MNKPVFDPNNPLKRPDDWIDYSEQWAKFDRSKIRRYTSGSGLQYWFEPDGPRILTSNPDTFLSFHGYGARDYIGHHYARLRLNGEDIIMTSYDEDPEKISFIHDASKRTEDGAQIWFVDELFREFDVPDNETYPWVRFHAYLPKKRISGIKRFRSQEHQEEAIAMIKLLFSCYNGSRFSALRGELTRGHVIFGDTLRQKLESGALIK